MTSGSDVVGGKRYSKSSVQKCFIGIKTDFEELLCKFSATDSVRYDEFVKVWRESKMPLIYYGQQDIREVTELTEECLYTASQYLQPSNSFQLKVGGLYMLYGLYHKQLCKPKVKIRMTLDLWRSVIQFIQEARDQQHLDVVYVFNQLRACRAFHFAATFIQMHPFYNFKNEKEVQCPGEGLLNVPNALAEIFQSDKIEQLAAVHEQYHRHKCLSTGPEATAPTSSANMIHSDLVQYITKRVAGYEEIKKTGKRVPRRKRRDSGPTTSESEQDSDPEGSTQRSESGMSLRASIKAKAFSSTAETSRSRRHRSAKTDSSDADVSFEKSPKKKAKLVHIDEMEGVMTEKEVKEMSSSLHNQMKKSLLSMPTSFSMETEDTDEDSPKKKKKVSGKGKSSKKSKSPQKQSDAQSRKTADVKKKSNKNKKSTVKKRGRPKKNVTW